MRYLLLDRIEELKKFHYAIGVKAISLTEDCFEHHFPGQPVYPGALLIESMAQLGGALLEISLREVMSYCPRCVLSTAKAKFRDFVQPGDVVTFRAEVISRHDDSALTRVTGLRGQTKVCQAELLFVFLRIDDPRLEASRKEYLDILTRKTRFIK